MNHHQINYEFRNLTTRQKQELWRQKQIQIFYGSGKPIFNINTDTQHIREHNNPYFYKDTYDLDTRENVRMKKRHKENDL
jgi:hypothetical protein|tara:strand:- start:395 stop:634 length:240 start_codon:yes stop_codon:yes gene_type:complete